MTDNITFQKTLNGTTKRVTIATTDMSKDFTKQLTMNTIPKSTGRQSKNTGSSNFGPNNTRIMDLLRMETRYEVEGVITEGAFSGDSSNDVVSRKNDLENMNLAGGVVTFNYDDETGVTGVFDKLKIRKIFNDGQDNTITGRGYESDEFGYFVKATIIKGVNMQGDQS